ncbi:hypothetical protein LP419_17245 [Massilia sp. H-1]|nr:hypothetical protein LP419_17245 [Massilia sp. H-1]
MRSTASWSRIGALFVLRFVHAARHVVEALGAQHREQVFIGDRGDDRQIVGAQDVGGGPVHLGCCGLELAQVRKGADRVEFFLVFGADQEQAVIVQFAQQWHADRPQLGLALAVGAVPHQVDNAVVPDLGGLARAGQVLVDLDDLERSFLARFFQRQAQQAREIHGMPGRARMQARRDHPQDRLGRIRLGSIRLGRAGGNAQEQRQREEDAMHARRIRASCE